MQIRLYKDTDKESWDSYVYNHRDSTHCHLSGWKNVIEKAYGHKGYYLIAEDDSRIVGVLPLMHLKSVLFGNRLVSMPFLNYGGALADSEEGGRALIDEAMNICSNLRASSVEVRHINPGRATDSEDKYKVFERTHKVRMVLNLPDSREALLKSFKAKLRSQITRPQKEGMTAHLGGLELVDSFYKVFSINMRELGSPVHSRKLFEQICREFSEESKVGVVEYQNATVAAGIIFCFRDTVEIPWASSLKGFNKFSPNMLLYWCFIEHACEEGFKYFDFGRSTPNEGTFKFKEQWGAVATPLHWQCITSNKVNGFVIDSKNPKYQTLIKIWQRLPISISTWLGPKIRRSIDL
jgi:FemAB-related protein (PEP-CTERM system-associated)